MLVISYMYDHNIVLLSAITHYNTCARTSGVLIVLLLCTYANNTIRSPTCMLIQYIVHSGGMVLVGPVHTGIQAPQHHRMMIPNKSDQYFFQA